MMQETLSEILEKNVSLNTAVAAKRSEIVNSDLGPEEKQFFIAMGPLERSLCAVLILYFTEPEINYLISYLNVLRPVATHRNKAELAIQLVQRAKNEHFLELLTRKVIEERKSVLNPPLSSELAQAREAKLQKVQQLLHDTFSRHGNDAAIIDQLAFYVGCFFKTFESATQPWQNMRDLLSHCRENNTLDLLEQFIHEMFPEQKQAGLPTAQATEPQMLTLRRWLDFFDIAGIKKLCLELNIEYENLGGDNLLQKQIDLLLHCQRHRLLPNLQQKMLAVLPNLRNQDAALGTSTRTVSSLPAPEANSPESEGRRSIEQSMHMLRYALHKLGKAVVRDIHIFIPYVDQDAVSRKYDTTASVFDDGRVVVPLTGLTEKQLAAVAWQVRLLVFSRVITQDLGGEYSSLANPKFVEMTSIFGLSHEKISGKTVDAKIIEIIATLHRTVGNNAETQQKLQKMENTLYFGNPESSKKQNNQQAPSIVFQREMKEKLNTDNHDDYFYDGYTLLKRLSPVVLRDPVETDRYKTKFEALTPIQQVIANLLYELDLDGLTSIAAQILPSETVDTWSNLTLILGQKVEYVLTLLQKATEFTTQYNDYSLEETLIEAAKYVLKRKGQLQ